jgi:hypothetical protein
MSTLELRPPLPPPLSHDGITFVKGISDDSRPLSAETVSAIAAAINVLLPQGDFVATSDGRLQLLEPQASPWLTTARIEAIERDPR